MSNRSTFILDAKTQGTGEITRLQKALKGVNDQTAKAATAFTKLKTAGNSLIGVLGSLGATAAVSGFLKAGVDMQRTQKTLSVLTKEYNEHEKVLAFVDQAAERFGMGQQRTAQGVSDLFARLRPMGISLKEIQDVYLGVNNAALRYNLSAADTEGVMLQLSQALGSGKLQGDEFRSVMERLPAVGQAIAKSMGVSINELKQLSSDGELTTDKIVASMKELANAEAPPPDAFKLYKQSMEDLSTTIGTKLLPAFTPLVQAVTKVLEWFDKLPGPAQTVIATIATLGAGLVIIAPALGMVSVAFSGLAAVAGVAGVAIAGLSPLLAPFLVGGAIVAGAIALGKLVGTLAGHIWLAKDKVVEALGFILGPIKVLFEWAGKALNALRALFRAREQGSESSSNGNGNGNATAYAEGGFANSGGQLAYVGEAGGGEYIVPSRKAGAFARNFLGGIRGEAAIPRFAEGGFTGNANVSITTGPVTNMNGTNYVTTQDLTRAVQSGVNQTMELLTGDLSVRRQVGLA